MSTDADFDNWNIIKKHLAENSRAPIKIGDVYWCHLGFNIGVEQNGKGENFQRPVIVIKKFSHQIFLAAPLTTRIRSGSWFHNIEMFGVKNQVILNQIKPIDTKRLFSRIGQIPTKEVLKITLAYLKLISP